MSTIEKALQKQKEKAEQESLKNKKSTIEAAAEQQDAPGDTSGTEKVTGEVTASSSNKVVSEPAAEENAASEAVAVGSSNKQSEKVKKKGFIQLSTEGEEFVSESGRRIINEEYRAIKRKVLSNAFGPLAKTLNNSNIIMVSSPNPNEGKTFTAVNLALSIALERDKTVLLVDADVLRPSVMKTIGQPFDSGLMEYLLGEIDDIGEAIYHTSLDTLKIIPAGKSHHLSSELLASTKMLEIVNEFATRYSDRVVIFDTPPLLGINETAILANLAGQAIVVVEEGKTNLNRVAKAVQQLNPDMAKGFVVNKSRASVTDGTGYYGYYYGSDNS